MPGKQLASIQIKVQIEDVHKVKLRGNNLFPTQQTLVDALAVEYYKPGLQCLIILGSQFMFHQIQTQELHKILYPPV